MTHIPAKPWLLPSPPRRILAIRLQAMGDTVITLPYLLHLRNSLPAGVRLDLLTREETGDIPKNIDLFDHVYTIGGARHFRRQLVYTFFLLPRLMLQRYEAVIDLQNNIISRIVRRTIRPRAWSEFDRFSPLAAGERTRLTIEAVGLGAGSGFAAGSGEDSGSGGGLGSGANGMDCHFRLKDADCGIAILKNNGWNGVSPLVVLNPAGAFPTRNWDLRNYLRFAQLWLERWPDTQFMVLGTSFIAEKTAVLKNELHDRLIDLVGQTTPSEVFAILQKAALVLTEDSGLMHMAWVSGIPTMVLFGGTRSDWSRPLGPHSSFLDSSDLACGSCMQAVCGRGDVYCLSRFTPEQVFSHCLALLPAIQPQPIW